MAGNMAKLIRQTKVLTKKNFTLLLRNRALFIAQNGTGVLMLLMLFVMDAAVRAANSRNEFYVETRVPKKFETKDSKFTCDPAATDKGGCFSVGYTVTDDAAGAMAGLSKMMGGGAATGMPAGAGAAGGMAGLVNSLPSANNMAQVQKVMDDIVKHNPGLKVRKFANKTTMERYVLDTKGTGMRVGIVFENSARWPTRLEPFKYQMTLNTTKTCASLGIIDCDDPMKTWGVPIQNAVDSAFVRLFSPDTSQFKDTTAIHTSFSDFPHPDIDATFDVVAQYAPAFMFIAVFITFWCQVGNILVEKEKHLVDSMRQMGMMDTAYWLSWIITNTASNTLMVLILIAFGCIFNLELFLENAFGLTFFMLWLTSMGLTATAFLFSSFTHRAATGRSIALAFFLINYFGASIAMIFYQDPNPTYNLARPLLALLDSPINLYFMLGQLVDKSSGVTEKGMKWEQRTENVLPYSDKFPDSFYSVENSMVMLTIAFFVLTSVAVWVEKVVKNEYGKSESCCFCLDPRYWCPKKYAAAGGGGIKAPVVIKPGLDVDVVAEAEAVSQQNFGSRKIALEVRSLDKVFVTGGCCGSGGTPFTAVDSISYGVEEDSCFVLLGHNGAGKSTTFNMLTGVIPCGLGDATVFGYSVKENMSHVRTLMGVCPQHDVLWDNLTGREHLRTFARMKGIEESKIEEEVERRLRQVKLHGFPAGQPASSYSGGMKRRLSIAIALLGDPKVIYLDEPTTGMDPVTRREVWDMIDEAKKGRVVMLTTHSMEEADILGDRIAIMSHGKIQAIGSSLRLKSRFGAGFRLTMLLPDPTAHYDGVVNFVNKEAPPGTELQSNINGALLFQLARADTPQAVSAMTVFFRKLEENKDKLGIGDYSLGLSTLEEVFLNLSNDDGFLDKSTFGGGNDPVIPMASAAPPTAAPAGKVSKKISITVPEGKGPGDHLTLDVEGQHVTVSLPEGCICGQEVVLQVDVPGPSGGVGNAAGSQMVKHGQAEEADFKEDPVALPPATIQKTIEIAVPEGKAAGDQLTLDVEGQHVTVQLPEGTKSGQTVQLAIDVPNPAYASAKAAGGGGKSKPVVSSGAAAGAPIADDTDWNTPPPEVGFKHQFKALWMKSWSFQKKNKLTCFCVPFFPVFILSMLLVLNVLVLGPLKLKAVCGEDDLGNAIPKKECLAKGPEMECLKNLFEMTSPTAFDLTVGVVQKAGRGRQGAVANDNGNANGLFYDLEQPNFADIPIAALDAATMGTLGGVERKGFTDATKGCIGTGSKEDPTAVCKAEAAPIPQIQRWHLDVANQVWLNDCRAKESSRYSTKIQCADKSGKDKRPCEDQVRRLEKTKNYLAGEKASGAGGGGAAFSITDFCISKNAESNSTRRRLFADKLLGQSEGGRGRRLLRRSLKENDIFVPTENEKKEVRLIEEDRKACDKNASKALFNLFNSQDREADKFGYSGAIDVETTLKTIHSQSTFKSGPLSKFTVSALPDEAIGKNNVVQRALGSAVGQIIQVVGWVETILVPKYQADKLKGESGFYDNAKVLAGNETVMMMNVTARPPKMVPMPQAMLPLFVSVNTIWITTGGRIDIQGTPVMTRKLLGLFPSDAMKMATSASMGLTLNHVCPCGGASAPWCAGHLDDAVDTKIKATLRMIVHKELGVSESTMNNICAYHTGIDIVRRLQFKDSGTEKDLDNSLYKSWFGKELLTESVWATGVQRRMEWACACDVKSAKTEWVGKTLTSGGKPGAEWKYTTGQCPAYETSNKQKALCDGAKQNLYKDKFYDAAVTAAIFNEGTNVTTGEYDLTVFFNNTGTGDRRSPFQSRRGNWFALTWLFDNAVVRHHTGAPGIEASGISYPRRFECNRDQWIADTTGKTKLECPSLFLGILGISILDFLSSFFFPIFLVLQMFIITNMVVFEKESGLRMIMRIMGLRMNVYWLVTYIFNYAQYCFTVACIWIFGQAAEMQMFTMHDPAVLFLYFFLWGHVLMVFSFVLSSFFKSTITASAVIALFCLIVIFVGIELFTNIIFDPNSTESAYTFFMLIPPMVMLRVQIWLSYSGGLNKSITMDNIGTVGDGAISKCFQWFVVEYVVLWVIHWYLENTVGATVNRGWFFFCDAEYWKGLFGMSKASEDGAGAQVTDASSGGPLQRQRDRLRAQEEPDIVKATGFKMPHDVQKEHDRVMDCPYGQPESPAVRILKLHKVFEGGDGCGKALGGKTSTKLAVKSVSFGVDKRECFGLLGHNGAGKTTTINMLCGMFGPTSGTAHVGELGLKENMGSIYAQMGVCPQHNVLWDVLTAREHLRFFGRLKGLEGAALAKAVEDALRVVNLTYAGNRQAQRFSGGMKRRLSVANSLIGNPRIVYLDEPSTGLDPASRRQLWDVISRAKGGKSIVLTTHSMEEADVLCDRIGIMANGELQCLGVSSNLKMRFGVGYMFTLTTDTQASTSQDEIHSFVTGMFPTAKLLQDPIGGKYKYEVVREEVVLWKVFGTMGDAKAKYNIVDWGITETTLEEVFLKLAKLSHKDLREVKRTLSDLARFGFDDLSSNDESKEK